MPASNLRQVMIIDDEQDVVDIFEEMLCHRFKVIKAHSGKEALNILALEIPDLILLDINMPEMNGWQVLEKIKQNPRTKDIPVVMLTAMKPDLNILEKGIENYLVKPVTKQQLISVVTETLNSGEKIQEFEKIALSRGVKRKLVEDYKTKAHLLERNERLLALLKQIYTQQALAGGGLSESSKNILKSMETAIRMQKVQLYKLSAEIEKHLKPEELYSMLRSRK